MFNESLCINLTLKKNEHTVTILNTNYVHSSQRRFRINHKIQNKRIPT